MKVALAQLNYHIGNFDENLQKILRAIHRATHENADLIIFSELAVCGYPPYDLLERREFIDRCYASLEEIRKQTEHIAVIIGSPSINPNEKGKMLYNSAFFIWKKEIQGIFHKSLLPDYDVFDEYRYFEPNTKFSTAFFKDKKLAITICEDLWDTQPVQNKFGKVKLYPCSPMTELASFHPDVIINIAASPFSSKKETFKKNILSAHSRRHKIPLFYVNQTGANTDLIFTGGSMVVNPEGRIFDRLALFEEDFRIYDLAEVCSSSPLYQEEENDDEIENIYRALATGVRDYFRKSGLSKAVVGVSGGIDSAVVLCIAVEALGPSAIKAILMPSVYSSEHSVTDAKELCENLGVTYHIVPIQSIFNATRETLYPLMKEYEEDKTEENIQARIRGMLLMAVSNKFGHILLNTTNKSEMAVGYGTLYGDMCGALSVLGDVYKTDVYRLASFINRRKKIIPEHILIKAPSAELKPGQKDSDSLPEYAILDPILYHYIELQESPEEIISHGFDEKTVHKVINMINTSEYKRFQAPPVLRVSSKSFGISRKMPLVFKF